ncbi:hypothetical protein Trydic_g1443 [Trypoxylus dichotomus]
MLPQGVSPIAPVHISDPCHFSTSARNAGKVFPPGGSNGNLSMADGDVASQGRSPFFAEKAKDPSPAVTCDGEEVEYVTRQETEDNVTLPSDLCNPFCRTSVVNLMHFIEADETVASYYILGVMMDWRLQK